MFVLGSGPYYSSDVIRGSPKGFYCTWKNNIEDSIELGKEHSISLYNFLPFPHSTIIVRYWYYNLEHRLREHYYPPLMYYCWCNILLPSTPSHYSPHPPSPLDILLLLLPSCCLYPFHVKFLMLPPPLINHCPQESPTTIYGNSPLSVNTNLG